MEPMRLCRQSTRPRLRESPLGRGRKAEICRKEPEVLQEIVKGAQVATKECQFQFRNRRWNCTTARKSLRKVVARGQWRLICISFEYLGISVWFMAPVVNEWRLVGNWILGYNVSTRLSHSVDIFKNQIIVKWVDIIRLNIWFVQWFKTRDWIRFENIWAEGEGRQTITTRDR